jgi:hypothetical protein
METKNNGAKILVTNWFTISRVLGVKCTESPKAIPTMNAPKMALNAYVFGKGST